ncbi:DUF6470 family protein [Caminicella sporogenes]|uniref:DUF6470 family protein n=1 Tax=Caminicella sporogenes TaxID=166485 RepID=UPI0025416DD7|nr:DUF6470 family protein [Caminicella sporogenes]WIF96132.1 DUF6470 family protein [Caminicella sporogenes]
MIRITSLPALIGINTIPAKLEIIQPKADVNMHTELPKVQMHTEQVKVQIDQYQCFAEAGLKNYLDLTKDTAQFAIQALLQGIERIVRQGNELAAIENEADPIPVQSKENAFELFNKDYNIETIPKSRPKIDFKGGTVDIKVHEGKTDIDVKVNKPQINYIPGKVEIYLRQKNSINIEYIGEKINTIV